MSFDTFQTSDARLYAEWKDASGFAKDQKLEALLNALGGVVGAAVNTYRAAPLPFHVMELEAKRLAVQAIKSWDASKGMSLASYVGTRVRQDLFRYVSSNQNVARIPEHQVRMIGGYNNAVSTLTDKFNREPSTSEIADHMGLSVKHVTALRRSLRKDLLESDFEGTMEDYQHDPDYERAMLAYYQLTEQEKAVFDFMVGAHGQPRLKAGEIAKKLRIAPSRVSALKEQVGRKLQPYLKPDG